MIRLAMISLGAFALVGTGCRRDSEEAAALARLSTPSCRFTTATSRTGSRTSNRKPPEGNRPHRGRTRRRRRKTRQNALRNPALETLRHDQEKWQFRISLGDFLKIGKPSDIPADLVWENGMDQPEIGDPAAKKGGVFRRYHRDLSAHDPSLRR